MKIRGVARRFFFFFFETWLAVAFQRLGVARGGFLVAFLSGEWLGALFLPSLSVADNVHNSRV